MLISCSGQEREQALHPQQEVLEREKMEDMSDEKRVLILL